MTDQNQAAADAKKKADETAKLQAEQRAAISSGKPTPTQDENDRTASGEHITEHEADGSAPDPHQTKQVEAKPGGSSGGGYQTRASHPAPRRHEAT